MGDTTVDSPDGLKRAVEALPAGVGVEVGFLRAGTLRRTHVLLDEDGQPRRNEASS